jgi:transposase
MFLRRLRVRKNGKTHGYWALVKSVRTARGPRQELVSYLGELSATEQHEYARVRRIVAEAEPAQGELFDPAAPPEWVKVDARRVKVGRVRQFGGAWLGLKLWKTLELDKLLEAVLPERREEIRWGLVGCILALARLDHRGSELEIESRWYEQTALADLLGVPADKVNTERLYRGMDALWGQKDALERHLKERWTSLFDTRYDILLYDVTSSYFEGLADGNDLAARGHSRDHRGDCKQVCVGLVVTTDGLPVGLEVFAGNTNDTKTLRQIVEMMEEKYGLAGRIWVMDRGIVSAENLAWLRERKGQYLVGTPRTMLRQHEAALREEGWTKVYEDLEVKTVAGPDGAETFILCRSQSRREKEKAMHERFVKKIEEGLEKIQKAVDSGRLRDGVKLGERIGALKKANSRAARAFDVKIETLPAGGHRVSWTKHADWQDWATLSEGAYLLRTNLPDWNPEDLWKAYMQLSQVEKAFHIAKDDLSIRPIYHKTADRTRGHILVCFLAYALWKTLEKLCEASRLGSSARTVYEEIQRLVTVDVTLPSADGRDLRLRCVAEPDARLKELLHHLGLTVPKRLTIPVGAPVSV